MITLLNFHLFFHIFSKFTFPPTYFFSFFYSHPSFFLYFLPFLNKLIIFYLNYYFSLLFLVLSLKLRNKTITCFILSKLSKIFSFHSKTSNLSKENSSFLSLLNYFSIVSQLLLIFYHIFSFFIHFFQFLQPIYSNLYPKSSLNLLEFFNNYLKTFHFYNFHKKITISHFASFCHVLFKHYVAYLKSSIIFSFFVTSHSS